MKSIKIIISEESGDNSYMESQQPDSLNLKEDLLEKLMEVSDISVISIYNSDGVTNEYMTIPRVLLDKINLMDSKIMVKVMNDRIVICSEDDSDF